MRAQDSIRPGEYQAPASSGTLTFKPVENNANPFRIYSEGTNGHVCELEGKLPVGKTQASLATENGPCLITFQTLADGYQVDMVERTFDACSTFCGTRASFTGEYRKVDPACLPKAIRKAQASFKKAYAAKQFDKAAKLLEPLLGKCIRSIDLQPRDFIRNDLAITLHHLGDDAGCLKVLEPLAELVRQTDEQVVEGLAPVAVEDQLRIARATRTNFKLCSAPKLEDNLGALIGRIFTDIKEIDPTLSNLGAGLVEKDFILSEYTKDSWKPSTRSPGKSLRLFTRIFDNPGAPRKEKILDVLFIDLGKFPQGAMDLTSDQGCRSKDKSDLSVVGVYPSKNADRGVVPYKAWYPDTKIGKFIELPPKSVLCTYDDSEH
jgi:hypothetical protein